MTREEFLKQVDEKLNATVANVKEANVALEELQKGFAKETAAALQVGEDEVSENPKAKPNKKA